MPPMLLIPKIFDRYTISEFAKYLVIFTLGVIFIFVIVNFFERIDAFMEHKTPFSLILKYYAYQTPYLFVLLLPVAELLAAFFSIGEMARMRELLAVKAAGVDIRRIFLPILLFGLLNSLASFLVSGYVSGEGMRRAYEIWAVKVKGRAKAVRKSYATNVAFIGQNGRLFYFKTINSITNTATGIMVVEFQNGEIRRRLDARRGEYKNGYWRFFDGVERRFSENGEEFAAISFRKMDFRDITDSPFDLMKARYDLTQMNLTALKNYISTLKKAGLDATEALVEFQTRFSFPFINFVILIFALPIAASMRGHGRAYGFGIAVALSFIYWNILQVFKVLGEVGRLKPLLAAWTPNGLFLVVGLYLMVKVHR